MWNIYNEAQNYRLEGCKVATVDSDWSINLGYFAVILGSDSTAQNFFYSFLSWINMYFYVWQKADNEKK